MSWKREMRYRYRTAAEHVLAVSRAIALPHWLTTATMRFVLLGVLLAAIAGYVLTVSALSSRGYAIADLEKNVAELRDANQQLAVAVASYESMKSIQARLPGLRLAPVSTIVPLTPGTAVARR